MADPTIDTPSALDTPSPLAMSGDPGYDPAVASQAISPQSDLTKAYLGTVDTIKSAQEEGQKISEHRSAMATEEAEKIKKLEDSVHPYTAPTIGSHAVMAAGIIGVLGMIGSKKMGLGAQGSMNALNSAIKGAMEGRQAVVNQSLSEYKMHLDQMKDEVKMIHEHYKTIIDDDTKSIQEKSNEIKTASQMFKDYGMFTRQSYQDQVGWLNKLQSMDGQLSKLRTQNEKLEAQLANFKAGGKFGHMTEAERKERSIQAIMKDKGVDRLEAERQLADATKKGGSGFSFSAKPTKSRADLKSEYKKKYPNATDEQIEKSISENYPDAK